MKENILDKLKKRAKETKKFWWEAVKEIKIENISCPNCGWTRDDLSGLKSCSYLWFCIYRVRALWLNIYKKIW